MRVDVRVSPVTQESEASTKATDFKGRGAGIVDERLEVVVIPVSDADHAKEFYRRLGWRLDADFPFDNGFRVVQITPPGSGCSVSATRH